MPDTRSAIIEFRAVGMRVILLRTSHGPQGRRVTHRAAMKTRGHVQAARASTLCARFSSKIFRELPRG
jgi:hypothetical protein